MYDTLLLSPEFRSDVVGFIDELINKKLEDIDSEDTAYNMLINSTGQYACFSAGQRYCRKMPVFISTFIVLCYIPIAVYAQGNRDISTVCGDVGRGGWGLRPKPRCCSARFGADPQPPAAPLPPPPWLRH